MKKIIVYASALVFAGGVSFAMEEGSEGMDGDMMMEAAPSVALGGSAKMGIKNHSENGMSLIREYEVTFSSSGVTDGGLMFGASISFDEGAAGTKVSDDLAPPTSPMPGEEGTATINGYVVEQDVWVQEGSGTATNALAEFDFDGDDADSEAAVSVIADDFQAKVDAWNADAANVDAQLHRVKVTFDTAGVATYTDNDDDLDGGSEDTPNTITVAAASITRAKTEIVVPADADTDTDTNTHEVRNGIGNASVYVGAADGSWKLKFGTGLDAGIFKIGDIGVAGEGDAFYAVNAHTIELSGSFEGAEYSITSNAAASGDPANEWSAGVKYNAGTISVGVGMDSAKGLGLSLNTDVSGVSAGMIYTKAENDDMETKSGLGVSAGIAAGEGANVTLKYSTLKTEGDTTTEHKRIEADFTYDLGGGATFGAGFENNNVNDTKDTTLEATIAMSF